MADRSSSYISLFDARSGRGGGTDLAEAALAKAGHDFKAVPYVVPHHHAQVPPLIIIPATHPS